MLDRLKANLSDVQRRIDAASARVGREPHAVRLVAITKYAEWDWVRGLVELGVSDLGESRPQQLLQRAEQLQNELPAAAERVRWHLVGPLQRNKVRPLLPSAALIHSADSLRLLDRMDRIAGEIALTPEVLIEVNISGEERKHGFAPDELTAAWPKIRRYQHLNVRGLMTMAPYSRDPEASRPVFRQLRELRDRLSEEGPFDLTELSMGMSGDFEPAIEEGATLVRIGSALFEGL